MVSVRATNASIASGSMSRKWMATVCVAPAPRPLASSEARGVGCVVDYHSCELFPERWFDRVCALTCVEQTATLYERLSDRGYSEKKIRENVECDIFQVVVEEAKDSFENVTVRSNATLDDMEETVRELAEWCENFKRGE